MSQKSKKYRITTETREVIVIRRHRPQSFWGVCPVCRQTGEFLSLETAAERFEISKLDVIRRLGDNVIHAFETPQGTLFFCSGAEGWPAESSSLTVVASTGQPE